MGKTCTTCGLDNLNVAHYCAKCGSPLEFRTTHFRLKFETGELKSKYVVVNKDVYDEMKDDIECLKHDNAYLRKQLEKPWYLYLLNKVDKEQVGIWVFAIVLTTILIYIFVFVLK